jgi:hypothetical protein
VSLFWFRLPGTFPLFGEHVRKAEKFFSQIIETNVVGMAIFTDIGMELTVITQVIENICHHFRIDAIERDLTPIVSVASEICDRQHVMSPAGSDSPFDSS